MPYVKPEEVDSPQKNWRLKDVLYDENEGGFAIAYGDWNNEVSYGFRWNGTDINELGYPMSSAKPTWFIVPARIIEEEIVSLLAVKLVAGSKFVRGDSLKALINEEQPAVSDRFRNQLAKSFLLTEKGPVYDELYNSDNGGLCIVFGNVADSVGGDLGTGVRWNGTPVKPEGNPTSGGKASWFIVPKEIGRLFANILGQFLVAENDHVNKEGLRRYFAGIYDDDFNPAEFDKRVFE